MMLRLRLRLPVALLLTHVAAHPPHVARPQLVCAHAIASPHPSATLEARDTRVAAGRHLAEWEIHDLFNLAALPIAVGLTVAAMFTSSACLPLVMYMASYMIIDTLWISLKPSVVKATGVLLSHHIATMLLLSYAILHRPHMRYVPWMTVVEVNTFFLILRRHVRHRVIDSLFVISWIAIRMLWFPYIPIHLLVFAENWPSHHEMATRCAVTAGTSFLAALQLVWSRKALRPWMSKLYQTNIISKQAHHRGLEQDTNRPQQWL